jgi:diketogulonate reductase-like aldo/keto reductase
MMKTSEFGWTGERLPLIGQGTWMLEKDPEDTAIQALSCGIALGMTLIDTAEMYGAGRVEQIVGKAIAQQRQRIFLISKVLPSNASYDGTRRACDASLRRLGTDYLDLYLLHWPGSLPISESMRGLESLVTEKKTRYIGVSNFDVNEIEGARRALRNERIACNQVLYHLKDRGIERRIIPLCRKYEIAVMGYSPFGHTAFPGPNSNSGRVLNDIAQRHGVTPQQLALRFLTREMVFAIPKSANPAHVEENAAACAIPLSPADVAAIDRAFPAPSRDMPLNMI